ncbi:TetR/AcrR family transcriptional regulator [Streptomyces albus]|uniref:TetR/AcrR family transcriptional regulator n=1 Tax=Streptomyces sp. NRRL F-5917 TaxID=1463873 RepID=UPI0004BFC0C0|nr:TetR family transcriptional regulator [Streptomyces sp. NRRL F-5917]KPC63554.1 TetR family transcriptional regulator [Streptomyces sp. NRRL F-6602]
MNPTRRDRLRDAAIEVLAEAGGRGLTHRAVDCAAGVPLGTAKNYFPSRDALLGAVAERCVERYRATVEELAAAGPPAGREGLTALLAGLLADVAGPGRSRLLAYLELQAEAARRPWLARLLDPIGASDFPAFEALQRAAGLPVSRERAAVLTLALHGAIPHLLARGSGTLRASGLEDPAAFASGLLAAVYPEDGSPGAG